MKWIQKIINKMRNSKKQKSPIIYSVDACFTPNDRWFDRRFTDREQAEQWMQRVVRRFENHKDYPLKMIFLSICNNEDDSKEVLENEFFDIAVSDN